MKIVRSRGGLSSQPVLGVAFLLCLWFLTGSGCLGKTTVRNTSFISPKKRKVFIAMPVNYTAQYLLDNRIRNRLREYFSSQTRFTVVDQVEDSDLYILLYTYEYQTKTVGDYGFGNREASVTVGLFVSDSPTRIAATTLAAYSNQDPTDRKQGEQEKIKRYYFKDYRLPLVEVGYVYDGDVYNSAERLEQQLLDRLSASIHELMVSGRHPRL